LAAIAAKAIDASMMVLMVKLIDRSRKMILRPPARIHRDSLRNLRRTRLRHMIALDNLQSIFKSGAMSFGVSRGSLAVWAIARIRTSGRSLYHRSDFARSVWIAFRISLEINAAMSL
jgi:hypothetical protein